MKYYLFAALVGCFVVSGLAQGNPFQWFDEEGRCWICVTGRPCSPCPSSISNNNPLAVPIPNFPNTCPAPDCNVLENRPVRFPTLDPRVFLQCVAVSGVWTTTTMDCQCDTYFDFELQRCEFTWDWVPHCLVHLDPLPPPTPCQIAPPIEQPPPMPPPPPPTNPPCQCIPWIPCWCNPCAMMPCGQCGGCQG